MDSKSWQTSSHNDISRCCSIPSSITYEEESTAGDSREIKIKNRFAVAKHDFQAGDIVLRNASFACSLVSTSTALEDKESQRCAYCFILGSEKKLSRCGRCQSAWYCSRDCQKLDFPFHKRECLYFVKTSKQGAGGGRTSRISNNDRIRAEICLLIRTYSNIEMENNKGTDSASPFPNMVDPRTIIHSGVDHVASLAQYSLPLDASEQSIIAEATTAILWSKQQEAKKRNDAEALNKKKSTTSSEREQIKHQMEDLLRIFRANNFGITDELLKVVASAVCPLGALLNHSCQPNCILRYHFSNATYSGSKPTAPPVLEIVASRPIAKGEEMTHSYVELVQPTSVRRERLKNSYGFECCCQRCSNTPESPISISLDWMQLQDQLQVETFLEYHNPTMSKLCEWKHKPPTFGARQGPPSQNSIHQLLQLAEQMDMQAKQCMAMDDLEGELRYYGQGVGALLQALQLQLECDSTLPDSQSAEPSTHEICLQIYQARGDLLGTLIVAGQTKEAVVECEYVVAFLVSILCDKTTNCPNHPILGLQLFTLGDLYQAEGLDYRAQRTFAWARQVLEVSLGSNSNMVKLLKDR